MFWLLETSGLLREVLRSGHRSAVNLLTLQRFVLMLFLAPKLRTIDSRSACQHATKVC